LKRLSRSVIHDFLPPKQEAAGVVVAFVDAARHVQLQAAVAQVAAANIGEVNPVKY
jgi:hypothetical protein